MNIKGVSSLLLFSLLVGCEPAPPSPSGFAGLGAPATGFAQVQRQALIRYPQALQAHPDFRIEWWYVTANLTTTTGEALGIQWTLFRQATSPAPQRQGWANQQLWLGHVGLTRSQQHYSKDIYARGGIGQAGVASQPFSAWIDHWSLTAQNPEATAFTLQAQTPDFSYSLNLEKKGPAVLQGENGYSVKSAQGQASHYVSLPFLEVTGSIQLADETLTVEGQGWLDREWSSQPLAPDQQGWDWFSLHLDQGDKVMLFRLRHLQADHYYSGTYISADGQAHALESHQIQMQPRTYQSIEQRNIPVTWQLSIPDWGVDLYTEALNLQAWMATDIAYWEGPIMFKGSHNGYGYLEMTGY